VQPLHNRALRVIILSVNTTTLPAVRAHYHVWADGHRVAICAMHATPGRLALFGPNRPLNPPVGPEACTFGHCYTVRCWVGWVIARTQRNPNLECRPA
jgi:hypothetical protein